MWKLALMFSAPFGSSQHLRTTFFNRVHQCTCILHTREPLLIRACCLLASVRAAIAVSSLECRNWGTSACQSLDLYIFRQRRRNLASFVLPQWQQGVDARHILPRCILLEKLLQGIHTLSCRHVIIETNNTTARIFPSVPDCETSEFWCGSYPR